MIKNRTLTKEIPLWHDYISLCKPKVVLMLILTALVGMQLPSREFFDINIMIIATIGIGFAASSAAVINQLVDSKIDAKMKRTQWRPLVNDRISNNQAIVFSAVLAIISMFLLFNYVNALTAILTLSGFIGYAFIYTVYLKHSTPQNIVYGGISGALPPLLGWTSMTNSIELEALLLTLIIFVWTPAHFWPLAIDRIEDYRNAKVPMLPVVYGVDYTKDRIVNYTIFTIICSVLPYVCGMAGVWYLAFVTLLGLWFLYFVLKLKYAAKKDTAIRTFYVSIYYLIGIFIALFVDNLISNFN